ncbi:sialidase-1 [Paenarthrobacter nicotinovorans]|uniref:sialidase family protein n=1 Tax=Micrococcaceae TaxID=1268 RepID=UPI000876E3FB|nr:MULTISPECIES: sialidase family protein [Micrococcaceae]MDR6434946.1 sialidase-1 [Paenarthrobacter nicotinovorans]SCZ59290.1 sialidase-1 [Arthrobacter sp. UNCCL28]
MTSYLHIDVSPELPLAIPDLEHVLAVRGVGGYRQYRIPALAVSPRGTLLAAYDGRPNLDDLPNPIDLLLRRSTDNGKTWGPQQVVRTGPGLQGFGDPSLLVDNETGRIFMFHAAGTHAGFFEAVPGMEPDDEVQHADVSYSDDDGGTWQHRRLTAQLKSAHPGITGLFAAAGQGIHVHTGPFKGRLVQQYVVLVEGTIMAASAFSDDHGETWVLGELIGDGPSGIGPNENKVVCLDDGRLLLHSRATPCRLWSISENGGQSWSPLQPVEDLPDPSDNGSLTRFDGRPGVSLPESGTSGWLMASNNQDPQLRRNTVLSLSVDNGATWPAKLVVCPGSSAYSTVTRLPDGNVGVLYERQGYREIVFASIPAEQLTDQLGSAAASAGGRGRADGGGGRVGSEPADSCPDVLAFDMELRSITPGRPYEWQNAGEFHVVPSSSDGQWDVQTWKEIGQGYSGNQVLGTREAQDLNYGPIIPGYKAGDILAFTGRARNCGTQPMTGVVLLGPHANRGDFPPVDLLPGEQVLYFTPTYTVTTADMDRAALEVSFTVESDGGRMRQVRRFRFDLGTGAVQTFQG